MPKAPRRITGCTGCQHRWLIPNKPEVDGRAWIKCLETGKEILERAPGECPVKTMVLYVPKTGQ